MIEQIVSLMKLLVGTDTANPPGNEKVLVDQLIKLCEGCSYERIIQEPDRESLVITIKGENPELVLGFAGHLDTVPIGNVNLWKHDPFGEITGNLMYGRGTADMRGGLAAMLLLLKHYKDELPPITLKFIFTADEEAYSTGAKAITEKGFLKDVSSLIICEPSNLELGISEKGAIWLRFTVKGVSSHASMPKEGKNALQIGMYFLRELKERIESLSALHPLLGNNTCEITGCRSGVKINIIPDEAVFEADIRTLPGLAEGNGTILQIIDEIRKEYEYTFGVKIITDVTGNREAIEEAEDSGLVSRIKAAIRDIHSCSIRGINFFTDGSIIIPEEKIPFIILGPGDPKQCHKADEHIELSQIEQCFCLYKNIVESYKK